MRIDDLPRKSEIAGIDVRRDTRIGGAYVLRREQEPVRYFGVHHGEAIGGPNKNTAQKSACPDHKAAKQPQPFLYLRTVQLMLLLLS